MPVLPVGVAGASGRMGRALIEAIAQMADMRLQAALDIAGSPGLGRDAGEPIGAFCGVAISDDVEAALGGCATLIDFTRPEGTLRHLTACRARGISMVIGTTGMDATQKAQVAEGASDIAIVFAPNMSVGVNLVFKLVEIAAGVLDDSFDAEIIEAHHRHKIDAPSGTALRMGELIAAARKLKLADSAVFERHGVTGERPASTIGFATVRGGDMVGDHTALFAGAGERVEITHKATSRATFAQGALHAARFLAGKKSGLYDMQDVLGLR